MNPCESATESETFIGLYAKLYGIDKASGFSPQAVSAVPLLQRRFLPRASPPNYPTPASGFFPQHHKPTLPIHWQVPLEHLLQGDVNHGRLQQRDRQ
jgi:hypothetical protein